jgi:hypothetical protein
MTVLEYLVRCGVSEQQARQHLTAGHIQVDGLIAEGVDAELPPPPVTAIATPVLNPW